MKRDDDYFLLMVAICTRAKTLFYPPPPARRAGGGSGEINYLHNSKKMEEEEDHYIDQSFLTFLLCLQRRRIEFPPEILYMFHEWIVVHECEKCKLVRPWIRLNYDDMHMCDLCCKDISCGLGTCATSTWKCFKCNEMSCESCLEDMTVKCGHCDARMCTCCVDEEWTEDDEWYICPSCNAEAEEE